MKNPQRLERIGNTVVTDEDGFLIKTVSEKTLQRELLPLIKKVILVAQKLFGNNLHSVYIRGSVAKGSFIAGISDLDVVVVTLNDCGDEIEKQYIREIKQLEQNYPKVQGIEKVIKTTEQFIESRNPVFKYQTVCVYGEDLAIKMKPLRIGKETVVHLPGVIQSIDESIPKIESENEESWVKHWSIWMCKQLIRSAHELVSEDLGRFARDIFPCYEGAAKMYPEQEPLFRRTAEIAVFGTTDKLELLKIIADMRIFLKPAIDEYFSSS